MTSAGTHGRRWGVGDIHVYMSGPYLALKSWGGGGGGGGGQILKNCNSAAYIQATAMYFRG